MANGSRFSTPNAQFVVGSTGAVAAGYKLYFYVSGTSTPLNTYSDAALTVPNSNPVVLDSNGNAGSIFLQPANYKVVFTDPTSVQVWVEDPVSGTVQFNITTSPNISVAPTGNPSLATLTSLNVQAAAASTSQREFLVCIGLTSNLGSGTAFDKVALYAGAVGSAGTANLWAINTVATANSTSGNYVLQGYECDINNLNVDAPLGANFQAFGISITGAGSQKSTSALLLSGPSAPNFHHGILAANFAVSDTLILDQCNETTVMNIEGIHTYGLDFSQGATVTPIRLGQGQFIKALNAAGNADATVIGASTTQLQIGDATNFTNIELFNSGWPGTDNAISWGKTGNRFTAIWAVNGTIQTSDITTKTDIAPLRSMLSFIKGLPLIEYKQIVGGHENVTTNEEQLVQATQELTTTKDIIEIVDGVPTLRTISETKTVPIYDDVQVLDSSGAPVVRHIPTRPATYNDYGELATPEIPAFDLPLTHRMPRMAKSVVPVTKQAPRAGKRIHIGSDAQSIADGLSAISEPGESLAGYVLGEDGLKHYRPDQILWALTKAFQEYVDKTDARIAALEAK